MHVTVREGQMEERSIKRKEVEYKGKVYGELIQKVVNLVLQKVDISSAIVISWDKINNYTKLHRATRHYMQGLNLPD